MSTDTPIRILKVNSSGRYGDAVTRRLTENVVAALRARHPDAVVIDRDVAQGVPFVTETLINAMYTPDGERTDAQRQALSTSDHLVRELLSADYLVLGVPIYNFGVPASLKAYFDQVARAGVTFRFSESGVHGLVDNVRKAYAVVTSNGVPLGSPADFVSGYIRQFLSFLGVTDVELLDATHLLVDAAEKERRVVARLGELVAA